MVYGMVCKYKNGSSVFGGVCNKGRKAKKSKDVVWKLMDKLFFMVQSSEILP